MSHSCHVLVLTFRRGISVSVHQTHWPTRFQSMNPIGSNHVSRKWQQPSNLIFVVAKFHAGGKTGNVGGWVKAEKRIGPLSFAVEPVENQDPRDKNHV